MCKENLKIVENARCQIDSEWRQQNEKYDIKRNWYIGTDMCFGVGHVRMPHVSLVQNGMAPIFF